MLRDFTNTLKGDDLAVLNDFLIGEANCEVCRDRWNGERIAYDIFNNPDLEQGVIAVAHLDSPYPPMLHFLYKNSKWEYRFYLTDEQIKLIVKDVKEEEDWV